MQWFSKKKKETITALRSSGKTTYVASVANASGQKPIVKVADKVELDLSNPSDVKKLVKNYQLNRSKVSYLLEPDEHQHIQIEKPNVDDSELKEAARWALQDLISTPVESLTLDVMQVPQELSNDTEHEFVYVFYADNERIAEISNTLIEAKVNLKTIEARIMAQRNIANLLARPDEGEAILSFSRAGALITFSYQGEICNARFIEVPLQQTDSSFEKIALEIQRSLDGFEAKFRKVFIKRLLVAPFDTRDQFCEHLRQSIYTDVETFDLENIFEFAEGMQIPSLSEQASLMPVLGAALRNEVAA